MADIWLSPLAQTWPIHNYRPKKINGRWSVDIVLRTNTMHIIFRHASFAEKQGGMCWHLILARYKVKGFSTWENFISPSGITLMFRLSTFDLISVAEAVLRVTKFNILSAFRPITSSIWPQMKECSKGIVFVSSRQSIFIYKSSQSEFICKSYSQYGLDRSETKILRLTPDTCW